MNWHVEVLTDVTQLDRITPEWEIIDRQLEPRTPFTSPVWIKTWWKHYHRRRFIATDRFAAHVVRTVDGELIAIAPTMLTHRPGFGPFRVRVLSFFGADTSITELRGIISRPEHHLQAIGVLADFLHERRTEWDLILWSGIRGGDAAQKIFEGRGPITQVGELPDYVLRLPRNWDQLRLGLSSNMRKNVRKAYESLERAGHDFEFRVICDRSGARAALDRFFVLHSSRAKVPDMIRHPDKFAAPINRGFLIDCVSSLAERGELRIFELYVDGVVVASRLAFLLDRVLYFYYAGYDPSWRDHSVMTILMAEALKWSIESGVEIVNLSTGADQSKTRWRPAQLLFREFVQTSPTVRGRISGNAYNAFADIARNASARRSRGVGTTSERTGNQAEQ